MKDRRFLFGTVATVGWLGFMAFMLATATHPTTLNEWGDFFAGAFAPIAFLWLVLGYLQQGDELRNSADALHLQAEELSRSVVQQSRLVEISRKQLEQEREVLNEERERRAEAARPRFVVSHSGTSSDHRGYVYSILLHNVGNTAANAMLTLNTPIAGMVTQHVGLIQRGASGSFQVSELEASGTVATLDYFDADGVPGQVRFAIEAREPNQLHIGDVLRTL